MQTDVYLTVAGYSFTVTPTGLLTGTSVSIREYTERFRYFSFNPVTRRKEVKGWWRLYDRHTGRVYLPRYDLPNFLHWLRMRGCDANLIATPPAQGEPVTFSWSGPFSYRNEVQQQVVEGLTLLQEGIFPVAAQTGVGKAHPLSEPLKTPLGWTLMRDIRMGDSILNPDGEYSTVTGIFPQGILAQYRVTFEDGRNVGASLDHLWKVECDGHWSVETTEWVIHQLNMGKVCYIPIGEPEHYAPIPSFEKDGDETPATLHSVFERNLHLSQVPLTLPIEVKSTFVEFARSLGYLVFTTDVDLDKFTYSLTTATKIQFSSIVQDGMVEMQCISVDHPSRLYVCKDYIVTHNTVSIMRTAEQKSMRTMVTMRTRLDQWESEFFKFTNASEKQLYIIKGRESLERLVMLREEGNMPDFIVASIQTMRKYVTGDPDYQELPSPRIFCEYFGIGMIGMDEFHEHLESNFLMMIGMNPSIWVPITATFKKKDEFLNTVVKGFAPVNKRLGSDKYHSFVDIYGYECDMGYGEIERSWYMGPRGYSGTRLEKHFIKKGKKFFKQFFEEYFVPIFIEHYVKKRVEGDRVFILFTLVEMCYFFQKLMTQAFPHIQSAVYVSGVGRHVLTEKELIITTPGSGGTGTDAPNVRSAFSFVAMAQETPLEQHLGRIRFDKLYKLAYDFVYFFFTRVHSHVDYEEIREPLYREKGLSYTKRSYPP